MVEDLMCDFKVHVNLDRRAGTCGLIDLCYRARDGSGRGVEPTSDAARFLASVRCQSLKASASFLSCDCRADIASAENR